jgi:tetratricopeptide (TPR) repeat protein
MYILSGETSAMRTLTTIVIYAAAVLTAGGGSSAFAGGELQYDPDKGFLIVDEKDGKAGTTRPLMPSELPARKGEGETGVSPVSPSPSRNANDLHVGRKKDPPTLYFMSGQEYYKNGDFTHAIENFLYADSVAPSPVYRLWVGKAYRSLGQPDRMTAIMSGIVKNHPESDVADDALLELAVYCQNSDDYEAADRYYAQIAEQYPFGVSYTTGESLIEVVRQQRKQLNAQLNSLLAVLGQTNEDVSVNLSGFQKSNNLKETGLADKATVKLIKKMHAAVLERDRKREQDAGAAEKNMRFALVAGGVGIVIILIALVVFAQARSRARQVALLGETLSDLDVRKL